MTLRWRWLVSGLISMPYIVNAFVWANVSARILQRNGWGGMYVFRAFTADIPVFIRILLDGIFGILAPRRSLRSSPPSCGPSAWLANLICRPTHLCTSGVPCRALTDDRERTGCHWITADRRKHGADILADYYE